MTTLQPEIVEKFTALQEQIWGSVTKTATEASTHPINFGSALVNVTPTADLYSEMSAPRLVMQFGFSDSPEHLMVLLLPQELFGDIATLIRGAAPESLDDNIVADTRQTLEAIVQGLSLAVGAAKDNPVVASDLTIRFQIFSFPRSLQKSENLARIDVAVTGDGINGSLMWLLPPESVCSILGIDLDDETAPFGQSPADQAGGDSSFLSITQGDEQGLDILMDIPLEISVELGRIKMLVKDVVELGSGSIVEIDKAAGEPVDVLVNGRLVARGEVVVIEDNFGVRITEILSPQDRLMKLNEVA